jgi:hypothetical protein
MQDFREPTTLEEAAECVTALLRQAEAAEAAGRDSTPFHQRAFEVAAAALRDEPFATVLDDDEAAEALARLRKSEPWRSRRRRLQGEPDDE